MKNRSIMYILIIILSLTACHTNSLVVEEPDISDTLIYRSVPLPEVVITYNRAP